jgi:hypothetical protein
MSSGGGAAPQPSSASSLKDKAKAFFESGKFLQAIDCYEEGASLHPFDPCNSQHAPLPLAPHPPSRPFSPPPRIQRGISTPPSPISSFAMPAHASPPLSAPSTSAASAHPPPNPTRRHIAAHASCLTFPPQKRQSFGCQGEIPQGSGASFGGRCGGSTQDAAYGSG